MTIRQQQTTHVCKQRSAAEFPDANRSQVLLLQVGAPTEKIGREWTENDSRRSQKMWHDKGSIAARGI